MPYVTVSQENSATIDLVKNQVKKLTDRPTMRWIFQMFQAVHLVTINGAKQVSNLTCVASRYLATFRRVLLSILFNISKWITLDREV
jgi:hypothetical protein